METAAATLHNKPAPAAFSVRPLSPALGAEISGVDLRDPIDEALKQKFLDAWHQHLVILVRNQTLDEDAQVRFAETFGPPAKTTSLRVFEGVKHASVMLVSNIRKDGVPIGALPDGEMHFHTDQCHQPIPAKATMLYAIEVPSQGGNTLFANAYTAYESLPDDIKQRLAERRALNAYTTDTTLRTAAYDDARASCWHPAVRTHPATGRKALYINRLMTREIEGLPREESDAHPADAVRSSGAAAIHLRACLAPGRHRDVGQPLHAARTHGLLRRRAAPLAACDHPRREADLGARVKECGRSAGHDL